MQAFPTTKLHCGKIPFVDTLIASQPNGDDIENLMLFTFRLPHVQEIEHRMTLWKRKFLEHLGSKMSRSFRNVRMIGVQTLRFQGRKSFHKYDVEEGCLDSANHGASPNGESSEAVDAQDLLGTSFWCLHTKYIYLQMKKCSTYIYATFCTYSYKHTCKIMQVWQCKFMCRIVQALWPPQKSWWLDLEWEVGWYRISWGCYLTQKETLKQWQCVHVRSSRSVHVCGCGTFSNYERA